MYMSTPLLVHTHLYNPFSTDKSKETHTYSLHKPGIRYSVGFFGENIRHNQILYKNSVQFMIKDKVQQQHVCCGFLNKSVTFMAILLLRHLFLNNSKGSVWLRTGRSLIT